jgi:hypothetical protein
MKEPSVLDSLIIRMKELSVLGSLTVRMKEPSVLGSLTVRMKEPSVLGSLTIRNERTFSSGFLKFFRIIEPLVLVLQYFPSITDPFGSSFFF